MKSHCPATDHGQSIYGAAVTCPDQGPLMAAVEALLPGPNTLPSHYNLNFRVYLVRFTIRFILLREFYCFSSISDKKKRENLNPRTGVCNCVKIF